MNEVSTTEKIMLLFSLLVTLLLPAPKSNLAFAVGYTKIYTQCEHRVIMWHRAHLTRTDFQFRSELRRAELFSTPPEFTDTLQDVHLTDEVQNVDGHPFRAATA